MIYFDHNATAPIDVEALRVAMATVSAAPANPSSVHAAGRRARAAVERARLQVALALDVKPSELTFTSGATEALHLAVAGLVKSGDHVLISAVEHAAALGACHRVGAQIEVVDVDGFGRLTPEAFARRLRPETRLVIVMRAQNELGNLYPVAEIAAAVAPVPVLCDVTQAFGKIPVRIPEMGVRAAVISGHKVGAPSGVGVLYAAPGACTRPVFMGGPQERGRRAGTENVLGIVALGEVCARLDERVKRTHELGPLRDRLADELRARLLGFHEHGDAAARLPNTLSFRLEGLAGDLVLPAMDLEGFCLSSGSACASGSLTPSPVLLALGLSEASAREGLRVSLGQGTTTVEIDRFLDVFPPVVARIRAVLLEN